MSGLEESDDEDWANDERSIAKAENWKMKESIKNAMKYMGNKTKTETTLIMQNYNCKMEKQDRE